jgi:hypothetical protein
VVRAPHVSHGNPHHPDGLDPKQHLEIYSRLNELTSPVLPYLRTCYPSALSAPSLSSLALAPSTLTAYRRALSEYMSFCSSSTPELPLSSATSVTAYIVSLVSDSRWTKVDSIITRLNQLLAVLAQQGTPVPSSMELARLRSGLGKLASFDSQRHAVPIGPEDLLSLVESLVVSGYLQEAAVLSLTWLGAFRLADVLRLPAASVDLSSPEPSVQLNWQKNQLSARRKIPLAESTLLGTVRQYALTRPSSSPLFFSLRINRVRYVLTRLSSYTGHSLRRGALQAMAARGIPTQDLLLISGHRSVPALLRYLGSAPADVQSTILRAQSAAL